ncbi:MAG: hypothetical protein N4A38_01645 [Candidatus Gracilibacteria bacterium]|nr:hypothetical protein [Candidatus Gracilibacteria bacterium]
MTNNIFFYNKGTHKKIMLKEQGGNMSKKRKMAYAIIAIVILVAFAISTLPEKKAKAKVQNATGNMTASNGTWEFPSNGTPTPKKPVRTIVVEDGDILSRLLSYAEINAGVKGLEPPYIIKKGGKLLQWKDKGWEYIPPPEK